MQTTANNFEWLTEEQVAFLCDTPSKKRQIEHLKKCGIPFQLSRTGKPRVTRSAVDGHYKAPKPQKEKWEPKVLRTA